MTSLKDMLLSSARAGLKLQRDDGSFPPGHNGSWNVPEIPVRNTSHWLVTQAKAYEITQDVAFKDAVEKAAVYLLRPEARPFGHTFHIMDQKGWSTNGIVGQAWVMEALLAAHQILKDDLYLDTAHGLIMKHFFNKELFLWHVTTLEGKISREHTSLNQQIWFTALAHKVGLMTNDDQITKNTVFSANNFQKIFKFNGKFIHMIVTEKIYLKYDIKRYLKWKWEFIRRSKHFDALSKGYITYSFYPLAILHETDKTLAVWKNPRLRKFVAMSMDYLDQYVFQYSVDDNPYAFTYHPAGFEAAYIFNSFSEFPDQTTRTEKDWISKQISQHYDYQNNLMCKNTCDPVTLSARFYEATRLKNMDTEVT
jgi:hypothetical protein